MKGYLVLQVIEDCLGLGGHCLAVFSRKDDALRFIRDLENPESVTLLESPAIEIKASEPTEIPPYEVSLA